MENERRLTIGSEFITYGLRRSRRAKHLRVTVYRDGRVAVTMPVRASEALAAGFVQAKARWITAKVKFFKQFDGQPMLKNNREDFLKHKAAAALLLEKRIARLNEYYGFSYSQVLVKNLKSKWGSCSRHGVLIFNYLLVFLPDHLVDYIVAHELCHLKEFNHSKRFWALVGQTIPAYAAVKKELKYKGLIFN